MMKLLLSFFLLLIFALANADTLPSIEDKTREMQAYEGYFPFYWESTTGKIWLEISRWEVEFLYVNALSAGVGSNDIGLDRGQLGRERVVFLNASAPKC